MNIDVNSPQKTSIQACQKNYFIFLITGDFSVTLSIFSGRRNPKWLVPATNPNHGKISNLLGIAKKGYFVYNTKAMPARLGFRGFIVQEGMYKHLILGRETMELQELLLNTMPKGLLRGGTRQSVMNTIKTGGVKAGVMNTIKTGGVKAGDAARRSKRYSPPYDPNPWHVSDVVRLCNNCYNYANIKITNNTAEPGAATGQDLLQFTAETVRAAAVSDGLVVLSPHPGPADPVPPAPDGDWHLVALVVEPGSEELYSHWLFSH